MKRLLIALAFALPTANAQVLTTVTPTASPASQVLALAPQLLPFAGDANFTNLANGLALGLPVTLTTRLSNGGTEQFTFTPTGTMSALEIAQTLEKARQLLISRGVATPTAQQLGTVLTGGALTTASGTTSVNPIVAGATTAATPAGASAATQSPAAAIQATNSPAANAAAGSTTAGVRNMSDSALPRGISDTPPQPVPGVTSPAPGSASTVTPAAAATTATPATATSPAIAPSTSPGSTSAPASIRVR